LNAQIEKLKKRKSQLPRELQSIVDRLATSSATASNQVSKRSEAQGAVAAAVSKQRGLRVTKVELVINPKAAKALGVTFPLTVLACAAEVIE